MGCQRRVYPLVKFGGVLGAMTKQVVRGIRGQLFDNLGPVRRQNIKQVAAGCQRRQAVLRFFKILGDIQRNRGG